MSVRNLGFLFDPHSVALVGASERPGSAGAIALRNLLASPFRGPVYAVNPKYHTLAGRAVYRDVAALPAAPDLAVICTPAHTVPQLVRQLGERGTRAAIILSTGLDPPAGHQGASLRDAALEAARPHLLRILGPACMGLIVPAIGLNASVAPTGALPGRTAFVSQSGALVTGVLDWAHSRGIGFSRFISLGEGADVDLGDVLDFLAGDALTQSILLYMDDVGDARKFMSTARAAARSKPTVVLKGGRMFRLSTAAAADMVADAAFRRAGMLRVRSTEGLFDAVETLAHARRGRGERLAIVANGAGPGAMAADHLLSGGGSLAVLEPATLERLDALLPGSGPHANPVAIEADAPAGHYRDALQVLLSAPGVDAVLLIHCPTANVPGADIARAVLPLANDTSRNVFGCWLGGDLLAEARRLWSGAGLPAYDTPEDAADAFLQIVRYRRNQQLLMQVPPARAAGRPVDRDAALRLVRSALDQGRDCLTAAEAHALLAAYDIPTVPTRVAATVEEAVGLAQAIGYPVALKIVCSQITRKRDVGGVVLDLGDASALADAAQAMARRLALASPAAELSGYIVQPMARQPGAFELFAGTTVDPVFGPVVWFGESGAAEADRAVGLPPLNMVLARDLVERTRVARHIPQAGFDPVCGVLIQLGQLVADLAEVADLAIDPLLAGAAGVLALDARVRVRPAAAHAGDRLAIRPYPEELERTVSWHGEPLTIRPIRPEDAPAHIAFFNQLTPEDVRMRLFVRMRELTPAQLARFTQIDYDREMAFIATRTGSDGQPETLGVARAVADPDNVKAEFAVTVRSDLKGQGLGSLLMQTLIDYCRQAGTQELVGEALAENVGIQRLAAKLGFTRHHPPGEDTVLMSLKLQPPPG